MSEFLFFIIGILLGGCIGIAFLCCLQINRINDYESQIRKMKTQFAKDQKTISINK